MSPLRDEKKNCLPCKEDNLWKKSAKLKSKDSSLSKEESRRGLSLNYKLQRNKDKSRW